MFICPWQFLQFYLAHFFSVMVKRAQGRKRLGVKNFKRRYFCLTTHDLTYSKGKGKSVSIWVLCYGNNYIAIHSPGMHGEKKWGDFFFFHFPIFSFVYIFPTYLTPGVKIGLLTQNYVRQSRSYAENPPDVVVFQCSFCLNVWMLKFC